MFADFLLSKYNNWYNFQTSKCSPKIESLPMSTFLVKFGKWQFLEYGDMAVETQNEVDKMLDTTKIFENSQTVGDATINDIVAILW